MATIEASSLCSPWEILLVTAIVVATDVAAVTLLFKGSGDHGEEGQLMRAQLDLLDIDLGGWCSYNAQSAVDYVWEHEPWSSLHDRTTHFFLFIYCSKTRLSSRRCGGPSFTPEPEFRTTQNVTKRQEYSKSKSRDEPTTTLSAFLLRLLSRTDLSPSLSSSARSGQ
ncbi:hypothetical protein GUJ93_ZPchr0002g23925 [Zizania palustris]|uniref:Uncharacterized protein n=1 Tax=Zizania palustris TaxID=103762 RepID=A0A8J5RYY0_ZIZPA|nr:hypothetical protein GUJ93_ZPchr0002g23925 [Zizania palustris]